MTDLSFEYVAGVHRAETRGLNEPTFDLSDPHSWQQIFGGETASHSGVTVTAKSALEYSPVWQAVNLISGDVAKLPLNIYSRLPDGTKAVDRSHPAQKVLRRYANPGMSAFKFWRRMMVHALIWNNAYAKIFRNARGEVTELLPLLPDRTRPEATADGIVYASEIGGELRAYFPHEIFHIEGISVNGLADCELVSNARHSWGLGLASERFASRCFASGGRIGGILELPLGMPKIARDTIEEGFRRTYERDDSAFKTVILRDSAKFHAGQFDPQKGQLVESRKEQVRDVARWYNLPPHKLGDDTRVSYNSLEQENRSYLDSTLSHWLRTIEGEANVKCLLTKEQATDSHYAEYNTDAFIAADIKTQTEIGRLEIDMGTLSPDEFRAMKNRTARKDGRGGLYREPAANHTVSAADNSDKERGAILAILRRTTRRLSKQSPARFVKWVDYLARKEFESDFLQEVPGATAEHARRRVAPIIDGLVACIFLPQEEISSAVLGFCETQTEKINAAICNE